MNLSNIKRLVLASASALSLILSGCEQPEPTEAESPLTEQTQGALQRSKPAVVLVHGAFADASGFQYLIPLLQREGYEVTGVQNPLTSVADDVASTLRVLDAQTKDVVLVGHSYGGVVVSAAASHPKVKALVYVAAFAPDDHEHLGALAGRFGEPEVNASLVPDSAGFLYIQPAAYQKLFAGDVFPTLSKVMAVTQRPVAAQIFEQFIEHAAWHEQPTWYVLASKDRIIAPKLQRFMAERMGAKLTELDSSHVPFVSQPFHVSRVITEAARFVARNP